MIKAVLFDFGGVVVSEGWESWQKKYIDFSQASKKEIQKMDVKIDVEDITLEEYYQFLSNISGEKPELIEKEIIQEYMLNNQTYQLIMLLRKKGIKTGIISNFPKQWFYKLFEKFQLKSVFDTVIVSSDIRVVKPDSKIFQEALTRLKLEANEVVFTDDRTEMAAAASKLGLHGIVFISAEQLKKDLLTLGVQL